MAKLVVVNGDEAGLTFEISAREAVIGRQQDAQIKLIGTNVSRRHARLWREGNAYQVEDLRSSNGTFLNGAKLNGRATLRNRDELRIGPYLLRFVSDPDPEVTIRARTVANTANPDLFRENAVQKLQILLQLSADLGRSLDLNHLLPELLNHLFALFPHAERGLVVLLENGQPVVRAHKHRSGTEAAPRFSGSIVQKVTSEGVAIIAEDLERDARFAEAQSICSLGLRSFMCVPLKGKAGRVFGVLELERMGSGHRFTPEDLNLLTAIGLQVSVALENAQLHQELLDKQRIERELALAREIQRGYLPRGLPELPGQSFDLHAELLPAYEISGDFYDYFRVAGDQLALAVADVSGKGMPAALFMSMVRALLRNLAGSAPSAGDILRQLNNALVEENPKCFFVTLALGIFDPVSGRLEFSAGGHPPVIIRRRDGAVETVAAAPGPLLGFERFDQPWPAQTIILQPGEPLIMFTDGITEAPSVAGEMFGLERLRRSLQSITPECPPRECAGKILEEIARFTAGLAQEDDMTMIILRRR